MKKLVKSLYAFILLAVCNLGAQAPIVSNISYSQRVAQEGNLTKLVDIQYNLEGNRSMFVEFFFSHDGGDTFPVACTQVSGDVGSGVYAGVDKNATWDASAGLGSEFYRPWAHDGQGDLWRPTDRFSGIGWQWFRI